MSADSPEELMEAFRSAALSVTKLYKTSTAAQAKSRADGYQDCLDDLLTFLDKERLGLGDSPDSGKVRAWIAARHDGRDSGPPTVESEDEVDKVETSSSPEVNRGANTRQASLPEDTTMALRTDSAPPSIPSAHAPSAASSTESQPQVPTLDTFNFATSVPYPQDAYLNIENLDLSDNRPAQTSSSPAITISRPTRKRHGTNNSRAGSRQTSMLGRGAGQKRKLDLGEIFNLDSLGYGKDVFGKGNKRNRHT